MNRTTTNTSIIEPINEDYEYIQYNDKLRLIHSIKDDMYQMQSIIKACNSKKRAQDWFDNKSTQELLDEMREGEFSLSDNLYQNRQNVEMGLRGYYIHRLLVNHVAIWASPIYAYYIMKLLDTYFENQRNQLQTKIEEQKPRTVPNGKQHDYKYMIWKEVTPDSNTFVVLHLVRRHKSNFRAVNNHFNNPDERWFYKDNLPISMSPNRDIKHIVKNNFAAKDISVNGFDIIINKNCLDELYGLIENYFNTYQE